MPLNHDDKSPSAVFPFHCFLSSKIMAQITLSCQQMYTILIYVGWAFDKTRKTHNHKYSITV